MKNISKETWQAYADEFDYLCEVREKYHALQVSAGALQGDASLIHNSSIMRILLKLYLRIAVPIMQSDTTACRALRFLLRCVSIVPRALARAMRRRKKRYTKLRFRTCVQPDVSIIIPCYNQFDYTYACLKSILDNTTRISYEIIIADDGSTDCTATMEKRIKGITVLHNAQSLGFLGNCNQAAKHARGRFVYFLNNDTVVCENAIDVLVETLDADLSVGMVGSKLLYPDYSIQEAGAMIYRDGSAEHWRGTGSRFDSSCNYVREVDYASGASLMIRRELWETIGGFDTRYGRAYCEDSDLAFEVRKHGYKLVYQPKSEIIHFEHITYKTTAANALMQENNYKLYKKWETVLAQEHCERTTRGKIFQRDRGKNKKMLIMVDDCIPRWDTNAGAKTTYNYMQLFMDIGYRILFMGFHEYIEDGPYIEGLQQIGVEVLNGIRLEEKWNYMLQYAGITDLIFINRPNIAAEAYAFFRKNFEAPIVFYGHDLHYLRYMREYALKKDPLLLQQTEQYKRLELDIMSRADIVLSVSPEERDIINKELGTQKVVASPIYFYQAHTAPTKRNKKRDGLLFVGGFNHTPNVDGIVWFAQEVFPLVRDKLPGITLRIAGSNPKPAVKALECGDIKVLGYVTDEQLDELYGRSRLCVIPLRYGAGVKGKTVDALYHGIPIVSTAAGLEGIEGMDAVAQPCDTPQAFADEVIRLYSDDALAATVGEAGYQLVMEHFSYEKARALFDRLFGHIGEEKGNE